MFSIFKIKANLSSPLHPQITFKVRFPNIWGQCLSVSVGLLNYTRLPVMRCFAPHTLAITCQLIQLSNHLMTIFHFECQVNIFLTLLDPWFPKFSRLGLSPFPFSFSLKLGRTGGCCCSVAKSCPISDPLSCSTSGPPVLHCLPKFAQIHIH